MAEYTVFRIRIPVGQWHDLIGDATAADALLDRLVHNAYRLELSGESTARSRCGGWGRNVARRAAIDQQ